MQQTQLRWRARATGAACLLAATLACGGGSSPTAPTATTPTPAPTPAPPTDRSTLNPIGSSNNVEARTSQVVSNGQPPTKVFDDFVFAAGSTIRRVGWQGIYCVDQANAAAPAPTATGFILSMHPDRGGQPDTGTTLFNVAVPLDQVNQQLDRSQAGLSCGAQNTTWVFYSYSTSLAQPFTAVAGTRYWLSVQATTPSYAVFWGWRDGTADNNSSVQLVNGQLTTYPRDRAYSLAP